MKTPSDAAREAARELERRLSFECVCESDGLRIACPKCRRWTIESALDAFLAEHREQGRAGPQGTVADAGSSTEPARDSDSGSSPPRTLAEEARELASACYWYGEDIGDYAFTLPDSPDGSGEFKLNPASSSERGVARSGVGWNAREETNRVQRFVTTLRVRSSLSAGDPHSKA